MSATWEPAVPAVAPTKQMRGRLLALDPLAIATIWRRDLTRYFRDRGQILGGISRPVLWLVVMGLGLGPSFAHIGGFTYAQFIFAGVIALNVIFAAIQSAISIIWDREFGFLKAVLVAPVSRPSIAIGKILGGSTIAVFQGAIALAFAPAVGVRFDAPRFALALLLIFVIAMTITSLGIVLASRMTTFEGFGVISNAVVMPLYFLSGALFPLDGSVGVEEQVIVLPTWITVVVHLNPMSYGIDALRYLLVDYHEFPLALDVGATFGLAALFVVVALWQFSRSAEKSGGRARQRPRPALPHLPVVLAAAGRRLRGWTPPLLLFVLVFGVAQLPRDTGLSRVYQQGALQVCMADRFLPYSNNDAQQPGFEQTIAQQVAQGLHVPLAITWAPNWNLLLPTLKRQQCDTIIDAQYVTPEMRVLINATQPYYSNGDVLVRRVGDARVTGVATLGQLPVGVEDGSAAQVFAQQHQLHARAFGDQASALQALSAGTVDAAYVEALSAAWTIHTTPSLGVEIVPGATPDPRWNAVIVVRTEDESLRQAIRSQLAHILASHELPALFAHYGLPYYPPLPDERAEYIE